VFKDKPGGLVVNYFGLAARLRMALADYTATDRYSTRIFLSARPLLPL
jgi:type I restriction enzyme R subunit